MKQNKVDLTDADRQRIAEMAKDWKYNKKGNMVIFTEGAEYATIYEREQQAEKQKVTVERLCKVNERIQRLEAERTELLSKLQERLDRCRKVSGYSSGFSDIHNEIDFLDLLLNSLKTKP